MRLGGSINWAAKLGRVTEVTAIQITGHRDYALADVLAAFGGSAAAEPAAADFGVGIDPIATLRSIRPGHWHLPMRSFVAHAVGAGWPDEAILCAADPYSPDGLDDVQTLVDGARKKWDQPGLQPSPPLSMTEVPNLMSATFPPVTVLLEPWLTDRSVNLLHSFRGLGKTHVALGIAVAAATGGAFLRWRAPRPVRVLYIDGEMGGRAMQARLAAIAGGAAATGLTFVLPDMQPDCRVPDIATAEGQQQIEQAIDTAQPQLLILDNLAVLSSADENEREGWLSIQAWLVRLRHTGLAVLVVHHDGKALTQRGHSSREDVLQTSIHLTRPTDYNETEGARFIVSFAKARELRGDDARRFEARLRHDDFGVDRWETTDVGPRAHPQATEIAEALKAGKSQRQIAGELCIGRDTIRKVQRAGNQRVDP